MVMKEVSYEMTSWDAANRQAIKGKVLHEKRNTYVADLQIVPACYTTSYTAFNTLVQNSASYRSAFDLVVNQNQSATNIYNAWQDYAKKVNDERIQYINNRRSYYKNNLLNCELSSANYSATNPTLQPYIDLKIMNNISSIVESSFWRSGNFMGSNYMKYAQFDNNRKYIFPNSFYLVQPVTPQNASAFTPVYVSAGNLVTDSNYQLDESYNFKNGLQSELTNRQGITMSYKWGYNNKFIIAQVANANESHVYYNSFEEPSQSGTAGTAKSGAKYWNSGTIAISPALPAGPTYKMSYWYYNNTTGQWIFSGELPYSSNINSAGTRLDEIRVFPQGANMSTYSYTQGFGVSMMMDQNNLATYYAYDNLGRLIMITDHNGKVVQTYKYNYKSAGTDQAN
jgi:YD repeat-containing protein